MTNALTRLIARSIAQMSPVKTQAAIAAEIGYRHPNMLSLIKTGKAKLPIGKVVPLAKAIGQPPAELFRLWLKVQAGSKHKETVDRLFDAIGKEAVAHYRARYGL